MFDCSTEALHNAIATVKTKYPASHVHPSLALTFLTLISKRYERGIPFPQALRESLTECHLHDDEREWYKILAGSLFGKRGGKARHRKPGKRTSREKETVFTRYIFEKGNPQGVFFFLK